LQYKYISNYNEDYQPFSISKYMYDKWYTPSLFHGVPKLNDQGCEAGKGCCSHHGCENGAKHKQSNRQTDNVLTAATLPTIGSHHMDPNTSEDQVILIIT
jgi:hypothetical protein